MRKYERKIILEESTMRIVAEKGMVGLSMRKVSKSSGVNESMIYRDFESKEKLLRSCYDSVNDYFTEELKNNIERKIESEDSFLESAEELWNEYTELLIDSDYKTLYYCEYRDMHKMYMGIEDVGRVNESIAGYDASSKSGMPEELNLEKIKAQEYAFQFFVESATAYAKKVIRREIKDTDENRKLTWLLLCQGIAR